MEFTQRYDDVKTFYLDALLYYETFIPAERDTPCPVLFTGRLCDYKMNVPPQESHRHLTKMNNYKHMKNRKWLFVLKVVVAILFLVKGFFLLLYLTWPFEASADRSVLAFFGIAICMIGYMLALRYRKYGGIMIICGTILFVIAGLFNLRLTEGQEMLLFILIAGLPPVIIGGLFIILPDSHKTLKVIKENKL